MLKQKKYEKIRIARSTITAALLSRGSVPGSAISKLETCEFGGLSSVIGDRENNLVFVAN